jgi:hypothetical protein
MRIIGLDPGGTTGWATYTSDLRDWSFGQMGPEEHHEQLDQFLGIQHVRDTVIVVEEFEWRTSKPQMAAYGDRYVELISKEYIGVVKRWYQERGSLQGLTLLIKPAGVIKPFVKDANIKKLGLWKPGYKHAMDATRNVLWFLIHSKDPRVPTTLRLELLQKGWK